MSNIQLTIQLDCSERLEKVLTSIAEGLSSFSQPASTSTPRTRRAKPSTQTEAKQEVEAENPATPETPSTDEVKEEPAHEKPTSTSEQSAPQNVQAQEITNADIRKAMNDCRVRVLGDKANDGILRKTLNDKLRDKVHELGCQSSTDLSQEQRVIFVKFCEEIPVMQTEEEDPF